jgi:hypothetical protein
LLEWSRFVDILDIVEDVVVVEVADVGPELQGEEGKGDKLIWVQIVWEGIALVKRWGRSQDRETNVVDRWLEVVENTKGQDRKNMSNLKGAEKVLVRCNMRMRWINPAS